MSLIFICTFIYNYFKYRHFRILEATTYQIMKSAKYAGSVVRYRIKLLALKPPDKLVFDELWIEDRLYNVRITKVEYCDSKNVSGKRQIIYLDSETDIRYPFLPNPAFAHIKSKILLGYQVGKKRKYMPIKEFSTCLSQLAVA
jgi:hypothetical protein